MGRGGLFFLPKNQMMNRHVYLEVLNDHLLPFMHINGTTKFLQDGAPFSQGQEGHEVPRRATVKDHQVAG